MRRPTTGEAGVVLKNVWLYLITLVAFLAIDFVWLAFVANRFYRSYLGR